jgi:hypothetical protein
MLPLLFLPGATIWQYTGNHSSAQVFTITHIADGFCTISAKCAKGLVIDVPKGSKKDS